MTYGGYDSNFERVEQALARSRRGTRLLAFFVLALALIGGVVVALGEASERYEAKMTVLVVLLAVASIVMLTTSFRPVHRARVMRWLIESPERLVWVYPVSGTTKGVRIHRDDGHEETLELPAEEVPEMTEYLRERLPRARFGFDPGTMERYRRDPRLHFASEAPPDSWQTGGH